MEYTKEILNDFVFIKFYEEYKKTEFKLYDFQIDFIYNFNIELTIKYKHIKYDDEMLINYLYVSKEDYKNYITTLRRNKILKIKEIINENR